jgi:hypothetical protein
MMIIIFLSDRTGVCEMNAAVYRAESAGALFVCLGPPPPVSIVELSSDQPTTLAVGQNRDLSTLSSFPALITLFTHEGVSTASKRCSGCGIYAASDILFPILRTDQDAVSDMTIAHCSAEIFSDDPEILGLESI